MQRKFSTALTIWRDITFLFDCTEKGKCASSALLNGINKARLKALMAIGKNPVLVQASNLVFIYAAGHKFLGNYI